MWSSVTDPHAGFALTRPSADRDDHEEHDGHEAIRENQKYFVFLVSIVLVVNAAKRP